MSLDLDRIGIAIVSCDGRFLVGTRSADGPLAGLHEFPGGKCEPGEAPRDCAVRECREETGLTVTPLEELDRRRHAYPHASVDLHFWLCVPEDPADVRDDHNGFVWVSRRQLAELPFPPANATVIERLRARTS